MLRFAPAGYVERARNEETPLSAPCLDSRLRGNDEGSIGEQTAGQVFAHLLQRFASRGCDFGIVAVGGGVELRPEPIDSLGGDKANRIGHAGIGLADATPADPAGT